MKVGKVWGSSELILKTPMIEIHKIIIEPNGYCSLHKHQFKWNAFYVEAGDLVVEVHQENGLVDQTLLGPGELTTVKPGLYHRFVNKEEWPVEAIEVYYPEILSEDIVRQDTGGVIDETEIEPEPSPDDWDIYDDGYYDALVQDYYDSPNEFDNKFPEIYWDEADDTFKVLT